MKLRRNRPAQRDYRGVLMGPEAAGSSVSEAYRILRTGVLIARGGDKPGTIVITSAGQGAGKSVTCANLALVFAKTERSVLVIDADMRSASQAAIFGLDAAGEGLAELLERDRIDEQTLGATVHVTDHGVHVLTAGGDCADPSERLSSSRFEQLLKLARGSYDVVLIDTAPVGLVTDAAVLSRVVDGVVFVVNFEDSRRRFVQRAIGELRKANATILGTVLNRYHHDPDVMGGAYYGGQLYGEPTRQPEPV